MQSFTGDVYNKLILLVLMYGTYCLLLKADHRNLFSLGGNKSLNTVLVLYLIEE